tara:strand:- start:597 stop:1349 length:753 start_codon:yes stop_codon:yes gene_type:complete
MWKYDNKWTCELDWNKLNEPKIYKKEHRKLQNDIIINYSDKIFLYNYFKENNIPTPPIIYYSYEDYDIREVLKDKKDYVVKPNNLCTQQGIFIVKNGKLLKAVMTGSLGSYKLPEYFKKFKRGYEIKVEEIIDAMIFLKGCKMSKNLSDGIRSGIIVEELRDKTELKVFCMLGEVLCSYYMKGKGFNIIKCEELAKSVCVKTGVDFVRIDIIKHNEEYRIGEFTLNPYIFDKECKDIIESKWKDLQDFHV